MSLDYVSVKVFLVEEEKRIDVRRFYILKHMINNYAYLYDRFNTSIPELKRRLFKLRWLDSDGDEVTITSDEELKIALSEFKHSVYKFTIRLEPKVIPIKSKGDNYDPAAFLTFLADFIKTPCFNEQLLAELYTQRVCKSCSELITSTSFKCMQCPKFYQCHECDAKNTHPYHVMLRISKEWADQKRLHHEFYMGTQERLAIDELQNNQKQYESQRKKQIVARYNKRGRKHGYKVLKKSSHKAHHILTYKKVF